MISPSEAYVEVEIPHLLVLEIGPSEKLLGEFLVQPPPSGGSLTVETRL